MLDVPSAPSKDLRLPLYVAIGAVAGAGYVLFDVLSESRIREGTLTGALAEVHAVVDRSFPMLVGALLGVCAHYIRLRARLWTAERAAARAEALRTRLQKVERDQAVWVLAAAVLHELNNPLHAAGLLLDEIAACGEDGRARADLVERARAQMERARRHLATLRGMRTVGEPELKGVTLDRVIGALADDVGPLAAEEGLVVELRCEHPVQASADPAYVRAILENLVDNALASLRERGGGRITIRLSAEDGRAIVRVSDDGPPIDAQVQTLFEPLRTTKTHGLGLGLPIARALARAMHGDLSLESSEAKTFRLELPLEGALAAPREAL
jgi:signal transduction histidine kinase